jgi:hypothetical protein
LFLATSFAAQQPELDPDLVMRESMVVMARQLGVTCTHCHDPNNFKTTSMRTYRVAKDHLRVTQVLNGKQGFGGKPRVDCYTCHRGEAVPAYREPQAKATDKKSVAH